MNKDKSEIFVLEDYESEFSYKKNKSNLNITFNRIAFIFFVFFMISVIYSIKIFYLGSLNLCCRLAGRPASACDRPG